jgi:hypothetical protein
MVERSKTMFQRIIALEGLEETERTIPVVTGVEVSEKDVVDAARYLAALQAAYARKEQSQAYSTDSMQEAERYCQLNFF